MARNIILLNGEAREESKVASVVISPGELIQPAATEGEMQPNGAAADADAPRIFADVQKENAGAGVDDDIASGDEFTALYPESGATVNARIAHGEDLSDGEALESDGNGALRSHTNGRIIGFSDGDQSNTSGSAALGPIVVA